MPKTVDGKERRDLIAQGVWGLVSRGGLEAATVRAVAAACGLSVGSVQHSFRSQDELYRYAMELVIRRVEARFEERNGSTADDDPMREALELLQELVPLDDDRMAEARVWMAFSTASLSRPSLAALRHRMDALIRGVCRGILRYLEERGVLPAEGATETQAARLQALVDGLTVGVLADPSDNRRREAEAVLAAHLASLAS